MQTLSLKSILTYILSKGSTQVKLFFTQSKPMGQNGVHGHPQSEVTNNTSTKLKPQKSQTWSLKKTKSEAVKPSLKPDPSWSLKDSKLKSQKDPNWIFKWTKTETVKNHKLKSQNKTKVSKPLNWSVKSQRFKDQNPQTEVSKTHIWSPGVLKTLKLKLSRSPKLKIQKTQDED